ncbi:hypothetical protein CEXT_140921 [Caerostris extrusa]|uniref:Uncharacterized protein n=1 Tax=Caerostris extrusa TaxID=172846 RepID=A0AAV4U4K4_CAEEX|nr:hypothetical protein CEXT_140921 [Caerostris extrusa]
MTLVTVSECCVKKLELLQNRHLGWIFGAVKTIPIDSVLLLTNRRPIQTIIEERALYCIKKNKSSESFVGLAPLFRSRLLSKIPLEKWNYNGTLSYLSFFSMHGSTEFYVVLLLHFSYQLHCYPAIRK